jgi:hypothetical protein
MLRRAAFLLPALLLSLAAMAAETTGKIKKCQDAQGRWHYGDSAAEECARSKVVEMSDEGVAKKEIAAPPTAEELRKQAANRAEDERKRQESDEQKRKDQLLLVTYGHEQDIIFVRDRKLSQLESMITASEGTLKSLRAALTRLEAEAAEDSKDPKAAQKAQKAIEQTKAQIAKHEEAVVAKRKEQETIRAQAEIDLKRYREIKGAKPAEPAVPAKN